ncbi:MAG: AbrB/MazE/SpoVT family DNA-binding domain-containing protein [Alphaproteobacteria bacterium]
MKQGESNIQGNNLWTVPWQADAGLGAAEIAARPCATTGSLCCGEGEAEAAKMTRPVKIHKSGGSCRITLPRHLLEELGVREDDVFYPIRSQNGIELIPRDKELAQVLESTRDFMQRHANAMRKPAEV